MQFKKRPRIPPLPRQRGEGERMQVLVCAEREWKRRLLAYAPEADARIGGGDEQRARLVERQIADQGRMG